MLLSVPAGQAGALCLTWYRGFDNNIYTQVGLVMLIGMVAKSAILMVEFCVNERKKGCVSIVEAAGAGAHHRFRALVMTELCMALGVLPLVLASGAGANSRQSLGSIIFAGMVTGVTFDTLFIPMLYGLIARISKAPKPTPPAPIETNVALRRSAVLLAVMSGGGGCIHLKDSPRAQDQARVPLPPAWTTHPRQRRQRR